MPELSLAVCVCRPIVGSMFVSMPRQNGGQIVAGKIMTSNWRTPCLPASLRYALMVKQQSQGCNQHRSGVHQAHKTGLLTSVGSIGGGGLPGG